MSLYSNLEYLEKYDSLQIVDSKNTKDYPAFYLNFYAFKVEFDEDEQDKFFLLFIRILDEKLR